MHLTDEIAELAQTYARQPGNTGLLRIDAQIARASADARWDDMNKWHRVRLRVLRLQRARGAGTRLTWNGTVGNRGSMQLG